MKLFNMRLEDEFVKMIDQLCKKENKSKTDIIKTALDFYFKYQENNDKNHSLELRDAENKNKQLSVAVDSLKIVLQESREKYELLKDKSSKEAELYERMLQDLNVDKTNMQDLIQQLKTDNQRKNEEVDLLQGKVEEIKKAGLFKRLFLRIA